MKRSPSCFRRTRRAAPDLVAVIVEDFRARPARAGVAHLPEIVRARDADDARLRQACDLLPEIERLVVVDIDGGGQLVLRQAEFLGDEIPGELDGAVLEIVAEREVAEHLEKGVMPRGVADIVEVVVLAAGAHAFLRGGGALVGPLLDAGKDVLELHHAGIGEHQRRVVARHQRRRRHDLVAVVGKEIQKSRPDLVNAAHIGPIAHSPAALMRSAKLTRFAIRIRATQNRSHFVPRTAFRRGLPRCPESVQRIRGLPHQHKHAR